MEIATIIEGRNEALRLVGEECQRAATQAAFTWDKLDRVRTYIKRATVEEARAYFTETAHEIGDRELGPFV